MGGSSFPARSEYCDHPVVCRSLTKLLPWLMADYYHYTDQTGLEAIKSSGFIKESARLDHGDDAVFRKGGTATLSTGLNPFTAMILFKHHQLKCEI